MINITKHLVVLIIVSTLTESIGTEVYEVPEPEIEVYHKGFRVAIPDSEGVNLFAFHGNINVPMADLEGGKFSKDILKKTGKKWIFEDTKTVLNVGDVLYYWLYVVKFNLGYRYDNGEFVVKEILPKMVTVKCSQNETSIMELSTGDKEDKNNWYFEPLERPKSSNSFKRIKLTPPSTTMKNNLLEPAVQSETKVTSTCCSVVNNMSKVILQMSDEISSLTEQNQILVDIAQKDEYYSQTLRVFGKYPSEYYPTPKDFVQDLIYEQLQLKDVQVSSAKKIPDNGVSFKLETLQDKIKVIAAAKKRLKGSNYELQW